LHLCIGILAALRHREATGEGQLVDVALLDSLVACLDGVPLWWPLCGVVPEPIGNFYPIRPPGYTVYPCSDGPLAIGASIGLLWGRFVEAIGRPDLAEGPDSSDAEAWEAFRQEGLAAGREWTSQRTRREAADYLTAHRVPCDPVQSLAEIWDDPQLNARGMFIETTYRPLGTFPNIASPIRLSATPAEQGTVLPEAGQHTWDVLTGVLGYDEERASGIIASGMTDATPGA
jgi:crotonobetainyl-CoA:carnitine CoA-transferase CaiB-like acyl-CoA transferase